MEQEHNGIKYKFFWNGIFSNWWKSDFTVGYFTYNCGEQFMMHQKALLFDDTETADKIMIEQNPREQKKLGRLVKNYNDKVWEEKRYDIVKKGLREKFNQNPKLKKYLLKYKGYTIVEASPYDRVWGIGFLDKDAISNIDNWGQNLLGKILTELTEELL